MSRLHLNRAGFVALITVIITGMLMISIATHLVTLGFHDQAEYLSSSRALQARQSARSCAAIAVIRGTECRTGRVRMDGIECTIDACRAAGPSRIDIQTVGIDHDVTITMITTFDVATRTIIRSREQD